MTTSPNPYRGFRFPPKVIEHAVGSITDSTLTKLRYFVIVTRLLPS